LPNHDEILGALTYYDLVGFQTENDRDNFAAYLLTIPDTKAGRGLTFGVDGRRTRIGAFPVSIETETYARLARNAARSPLAKEIGESLDGVVSPPFETMSGALAIAAIVGNAGAQVRARSGLRASTAPEPRTSPGPWLAGGRRCPASRWDRILQAGDVEAAIIAFLLVFNAALGLSARRYFSAASVAWARLSWIWRRAIW
jgi:hypothetical protein